ncbi:glucosaminidase domain-containing protein, partial [Brevibacillus sp. MCWH]|uniref:glucosaminidase domain-containing protein n=1 Tax=Brevibacillus sp. MCWH TaxID=2508871 RepID=UPI001C0EBF02
RKEPNLSSKITDVLVKDYVVEATEELENGWLLLKQGGYINGKYVNKIEEQEAVKLIFQQNQKPKPQPKFTTVERNKNQLISRSKSNNANKSIRLDVVAPSNASIDDLRKILDGTALEGIEHALLEVEDKFGINALFTLAVAKLESAHGKSKLARHKNNLFGMNAVDGSAYE